MVSRIAAAKSLTMTGDSTSLVINERRSPKVQIARIGLQRRCSGSPLENRLTPRPRAFG